MTTKYFCGTTEIVSIHPMKNTAFDASFMAGRKCRRWDSFSRMVGYSADGELMPVERTVHYKDNNPSLHKCDGRCLNAKGRNCECSCGGSNHGAGNI